MKKKILFVITKSEIGGAQKWVKEQIDILSENGFKCFICSNQEGWLTQESKSVKNLTDTRIEKRSSLGFLLKLRSFIMDNDIGLLIGNSANGGIYSRLAAFITRKKCIYVSHGWSSVYNGGNLAFAFNLIEQLLARISSKILCVSNNDYRIALEKIKIKKNKLITIPNKIFPVSSDSNDLQKNKFCSGTIKILFLGRLASPKSPLPIIEAITGNTNFQLDIVGSGPDEYLIQQYLRKKNNQNSKLLGEIIDFNRFQEYDIFCLISQSEGLPLSAVEALSCGLPILISNVGGCPDVIQNNGYLTNNIPKDILNGLKVITKNIEEFSNNSTNLFSTKFDLSKNYQEYIDLYEKV